MKIIKIVSEKFSQNSYLVVEDKDAILVDGGVFVKDIEENLKLLSPKPTLKAVFLTHEHFDHILEVDNIIAKYSCPVYIHEMGKNSLYKEDENMSILDNPMKLTHKKEIKKFKDGESFDFGGVKITCHHTPGHSLGSSVFVVDNNMFTGDTIFKVEHGRTDLFGGNPFVQQISFEKLRNNLIAGIDNFYPGHGANFTFEDIEYNLKHYFGEE